MKKYYVEKFFLQLFEKMKKKMSCCNYYFLFFICLNLFYNLSLSLPRFVPLFFVCLLSKSDILTLSHPYALYLFFSLTHTLSTSLSNSHVRCLHLSLSLSLCLSLILRHTQTLSSHFFLLIFSLSATSISIIIVMPSTTSFYLDTLPLADIFFFWDFLFFSYLLCREKNNLTDFLTFFYVFKKWNVFHIFFESSCNALKTHFIFNFLIFNFLVLVF